MPLAEAKHIDIGVEGEQDAQLWVNELDMIAVVKNLVDNAIRYTPDGGRVDLSVTTEEGRAILRIQDSGPGFKSLSESGCLTRSIALLGAIKSDQVWGFPSSRQSQTGLALKFN
jgi:two-component system OmpR family sensor kinase